MPKSIDVTTLSGWGALSEGNHAITIVAKAAGYSDSEPSAAVSVTKAPQEYTDCITFTGESSDFTLTATNKEWNGTVEYSTDHNTWTTWNGTAVSSVDKKLYLRGSGNTKFYTGKGARLSLSARAACSGNIQTLLEYSNPPTSIAATYCYMNMFNGCTNLTTAPELPATTLASWCYANMFSGCTSLTSAPNLPAIALANSCYYAMFFGCSSLTTAPELPATTLADSCYRQMFYKCTSLKISETQSSEYPTAWRIPSSGTISSTASTWNDNMLLSTGGTFASNPSVNTTYYGAWEGSSTEDPLAGTWVFNDEITWFDDPFHFTYIDSEGQAESVADLIFNFESNDNTWYGIYYLSSDVGTPSIGTDAYIVGSGWTEEAYKTINITSKLSEVTDGDTLLEWLQANATKQ